jgi:hypothetical protein
LPPEKWTQVKEMKKARERRKEREILGMEDQKTQNSERKRSQKERKKK